MPLDRPASEAAERCVYCPKMCRFSCPVGHESARETLTPWGKMTLLKLSADSGSEPLGLPGKLEGLAQKARGLIDSTPRQPLDADTAEMFYGCSGCLRCRTFCDHENDVPHALYQGRATAVEQGLQPAAARIVAERFARVGHAQDQDPRGAIEALARAHPLASSARTAYFAGCEAPCTNPASISAALRASEALDAGIGVAREPVCCGRPLFEAGYRREFREHVEDVWDRLGDREIVTPSAACARALTEYARESGVEPRGTVVHVTTWLARHLGAGTQAAPLKVAVTYHDPCHLGRGLGEYDAPRRLLAAALETPPKEPFATREEADCCGAAGLVPRTFPDIARAMAMSRADDLRGGKVATACPSCQAALKGAGLDVVDVAELFAEWITGSRA